MHDIWNPWHGCRRCSEGCQNCYMYYLDDLHGRDGADIRRNSNAFRYPLAKDRAGNPRIQSGELIRVCMTSDFFLAEADAWRQEAWQIMRKRPDVIFFLLTKRPERVKDCLPDNWGDGWENIFFNVTAENQKRADERIPILLELPFRHKGVMCAPLIGPVSLSEYLDSGQIEQVLCDGESYGGLRPCHYEWVKSLHDECADRDITFVFCSTGRRFVKDGREYAIENGDVMREQAYRSGLTYKGKNINFCLTDLFGRTIPEEERYQPRFRQRCLSCGMRIACNGCSDCGKCHDPFVQPEDEKKPSV